MMVCSVSAVLVLVVISILSTAYGDDSLWYNYLNSIGPTLTNAFQYPGTLRQALDNHVNVMESQNDIMMYECRSYKQGEHIARLEREGGIPNVTLVPFLVDGTNDRMCFLRITKPDKRDEFIDASDTFYRLPILDALKLDSSIYSSLQNKNHDPNKQMSVVFSFRQETFGVDQYNESIDCFRALQGYIQEIDNYSFEELAHYFFWTSPFAYQYFYSEGAIEHVNESYIADSGRFKQIQEALLPISQHASNAYGYNPEPPLKIHDHCSLSSLIQSESLIYTPGSISVPIERIANEKDQATRYSCLFVLAMALSLHNASHHIALQESPQLLNFRARSIPQSATASNQLSNQPYTKAGILGDGQIVTIADTGLDVYSCYFYDPAGRVAPSKPNAPQFNQNLRKVIGYIYNSCGDQTDTDGGHGTHVSGTVAGSIVKADIGGAGQYDGVAPNAKLIMNDFSRGGSGLCIPGAQQLYGIGYSGGARIHTNSWGSPFTAQGYYSTADTDNYLHNNPGMTVFFAGGNFGANGIGTSSITMESTAKNVIGVASGQTTFGSANISYVAWYSSKGPTYDGRFKPDIVAPGDSLMSAMASGSSNSQTCKTIGMTGTSMASPAAAGSAALIRQYFMDNNRRFWTAICKSGYRSCKAFTPTGYLVKALIIHSGMQMTLFNGGGQYDVQLKKPPDFIQGFGRIGLHTVLPLKGVISSFDLFVADSVNVGENSMVGYIINISTANKPLTVTIAWYDPPNVQGTMTKSLINDLDLVVTNPSGKKFFPNGRTFPDSNNNVEKISLPSVVTGKWKVTVSANALPVSGNQLFAIVITSAGTVSYA